MTSDEWRPGAPVEQAIVDALHGDDWPRFAELLGSTKLLVADGISSEGAAAQRLAGQLPAGATYVLAYTSTATMSWVFGAHAPGYEVLDLAALRQRWPDPAYQLAVNAGTPIAVFLPPAAIGDLATGATSLVSLPELQHAVGQGVLAQVRAECLRDLSGHEPASEQLRNDPALNSVERELRRAVEEEDSDGFLVALLRAELVVPTTAPVTDPGQLYEDGFPWRFVGGEATPAVPLFSSVAMLERTGAPTAQRIEAHALDIFANWPADECAMVLNPGSVTELILPGEAVRELVTAVVTQPAEAAAEDPPALGRE